MPFRKNIAKSKRAAIRKGVARQGPRRYVLQWRLKVTKDGRAFQTRGAMTEKARSPIIYLRRYGSTASADVDAERILRLLESVRASHSTKLIRQVRRMKFETRAQTVWTQSVLAPAASEGHGTATCVLVSEQSAATMRQRDRQRRIHHANRADACSTVHTSIFHDTLNM